MEVVRIKTLSEMGDFGGAFLRLLEPRGHALVIALNGQLGAGKTTFTQALARSLGVVDTVNSPTFVIQKIYVLSGQKWDHLIHIDAYRIKSGLELQQLGWENLISEPKNLLVVEWPENVKEIIPNDACSLTIETGEHEERVITYQI